MRRINAIVYLNKCVFRDKYTYDFIGSVAFLSCIYNYIVTYGCFDRNQLLTKNWARFMIDFSMVFQIRWQIGFSVTPS